MGTILGEATIQELRESLKDIATVMVRSEPFVEYLHLARFADRWLIVNALYPVIDAG